MNRRQRREYLIATGFAVVVGVIAAFLIWTLGTGRSYAIDKFDVVSETAEDTTKAAPDPETATVAQAAATRVRVRPERTRVMEESTSSAQSVPSESPEVPPEPVHSAPADPRSRPIAWSDYVPDQLPGWAPGRLAMSAGISAFLPAAPGGMAYAPPDSVVSAADVTAETSHETARTARTDNRQSLAVDDAVVSAPPPDTSLIASVLEQVAPSAPAALAPLVSAAPVEASGSALTEEVAAFDVSPVSVGSAPGDEPLLVLSLLTPPDIVVMTPPAATPAVVNPEPATLFLLGGGLAVAAQWVRRRRQPATRA
jgi:hypothetical protein